MGLFEDDQPPPAKKRSRKKAATALQPSDGAVQRLFDVYHKEFLRRWNPCAAHGVVACQYCADDQWRPRDPEHLIKPLYEGGRDAKAFKDLKDAWSEETVADLLRQFFASTDPQIVRSDYKVKVFFQHAQRLRLSARPRDDRTVANIDAAARARRQG